MQDTMTRYLATFDDASNKELLRSILGPIVDRYSSLATSTAGLVVTATTGHYVPKTGSVPFAGIVQGVPVAIAAGTDMPTLVGTITAGSYNVFCFFIDRASVVTVAMGTEGTTLAGVKFPQFPAGKALVGYIVVTYASTFTGGSTALDTATTVYVSPIGGFDPTVLV